MSKKKKLVIFLFGFFYLFVFLCLYFSSLALSGKTLFLDVVNNKQENFSKNYLSWKNKAQFIKPLKEFNEFLPQLVGIGKETNYLVLLQNNWELRPSGGFMGSYGKLSFKNGGLTNIKVEDIYVPDGQIPGHVDPPEPIQKAFKQGFWKLRDSNWEIDFMTASKQILWFFEKGGEKDINGLIALNFIFLKDLLDVFGPINLVDYKLDINSSNFVNLAQEKAQADFFPGSSQKKDFLSSLTKELIFRFKDINYKESFQLLKVIFKNLNQKQILLSFNSKVVNQYFSKFNWTGEIKRLCSDKENIVTDYLYLVETNLGANKANCCLERKVEQNISFENSLLKEKLILGYKNNSPEKKPSPPQSWGGIYENYLRILIPLESENIIVKINDQQIKENIDLKEYQQQKVKSIGFFVIVDPLSEKKVEVSFQKKVNHKANKYYLEIQKQPGVESFPFIINFISQDLKTTKTIKADSILKFSLID
ncbi:hypothetical protein COT75_01005 [Candidatus Beckwithbacteria bacterium CG10_big_fil_rev_8_21_14_0_10_34_10]|uniref:DUF4012 domain-containing protein n=1 Tax=Candidatus Beckwithbacteria bacterium CG10_big_fil_rev_8_21_14_0_10_34_10 TaxID=1974495 RepID=A0A2H0WA48_9BACT|nr:MAG: hypothetical protein COT75_01005 [Candidatus Beckwithbacteria bacterium CG10_big_fil_rev_8_21_14_0_10_34_10]